MNFEIVDKTKDPRGAKRMFEELESALAELPEGKAIRLGVEGTGCLDSRTLQNRLTQVFSPKKGRLRVHIYKDGQTHVLISRRNGDAPKERA